MEENVKFKVGDSVRFKKTDGYYLDYPREYKITRISPEFIYIENSGGFYSRRLELSVPKKKAKFHR